MSDIAAIAADLRAHFALCEELLLLVERESHSLRDAGFATAFEFSQQRKDLLPRLAERVARVKSHRSTWQSIDAASRRQNPEVERLIRVNQDMIMKVILLDRENEQARLRQGLLPANQLPSASRQRPHYVSELYRRSAHH
ncbi:MAG: hypothetical protein QOF48_3822 [Verrucomicrobiota bacterium]|jgi:hypothetical protein